MIITALALVDGIMLVKSDFNTSQSELSDYMFSSFISCFAVLISFFLYSFIYLYFFISLGTKMDMLEKLHVV